MYLFYHWVIFIVHFILNDVLMPRKSLYATDSFCHRNRQRMKSLAHISSKVCVITEILARIFMLYYISIQNYSVRCCYGISYCDISLSSSPSTSCRTSAMATKLDVFVSDIRLGEEFKRHLSLLSCNLFWNYILLYFVWTYL